MIKPLAESFSKLRLRLNVLVWIYISTAFLAAAPTAATGFPGSRSGAGMVVGSGSASSAQRHRYPGGNSTQLCFVNQPVWSFQVNLWTRLTVYKNSTSKFKYGKQFILLLVDDHLCWQTPRTPRCVALPVAGGARVRPANLINKDLAGLPCQHWVAGGWRGSLTGKH